MTPSVPGRNRGGEWWDRLDLLFEEACTLLEGERAAFLDRACGSDAELRAQLAALLRHPPAPESASLPGSEPGSGPSVGEASPEPDNLVGTTLHHYRIEARLGGGGMGIVYRARDLVLERPVAIKFLSPALSAIPSAKTRFLVEARAAAAIDHPNICAVHEVGETGDGAPFIAMQYYEGETLKDKLARGPLPVGAVVDYVLQTAAGVRAAHACGVLHRDVKPGNIFITRDAVAKLIDFGVAKMGDLVLTKAGVALGTVGYMSPEQLQCQPVDVRTDVWSLGVVLFEALAGQPPFHGDHPMKVVRSAVLEDPPSLLELRPDVPPAVEAVVLRALAKSPEGRQPTADRFVAELRAAASSDHGAAWIRRQSERPAGQSSPP